MTAEVAIMNKLGVALAADSAVTLGTGGKIYNSADKLFSLSKFRPVGIMIYGSANFSSTPWEVLIKDYRHNILGKKSFRRLEQYADHFINFLRTTKKISRECESNFVASMCYTALRHTVEKIKRDTKKVYDAGAHAISASDTKNIVKSRIASEKKELEALSYVDNGSQTEIQKLIRVYGSSITQLITNIFQNLPLDPADIRSLRRICALAVYKDRFTTGQTGIVIAGYGNEDIFPSLVCYEMEGRIGRFLKMKQDLTRSRNISLKNMSSIGAFAQSEMVATFMNGIHPEYLQTLDELQTEVFSRLASILQSLLNGKAPKAKIERLSAHLKSVWPDSKQLLQQFTRDRLVMPILGTVAALPKDELSSMAEALVSLTSFRRKVTPDAETVGGPIDVLVISKGDGLVWIKRKHYFDPKLNHHYFSNYYQEC